MRSARQSWNAGAGWWLVAVVCVASACSARGGTSAGTPISNEDVVANVNGEPVVVAEFVRAIDHERAVMTASGLRPIDVVKRAALDTAVRTKLEQVLMRDQGQISDVSYRSFLSRWQQENARRRDATQRGELIYGVQEYEEQEYFEYLLSTGEIALKEHLPGLAPSEAELRQEYDALRESTFRRGKQRTLDVIRSVYPPGAGPEQKARSRATMDALASRLRAGKPPSSAPSLAAGVTVSRTSLGEQRSRGSDRSLEPDVVRIASALQPGASSDVLETGRGLVIVHCAAIEDLGYVSFEDAKGRLVRRHVDEAFEARVRGLVASADVQLRPDVYDRITVR